VSLAKGQRLREIGSKRKLIQKLEEHFGITEAQGPQVKKERIEITTAALVSVLFIAGFWFSISRGLETLVTFDVPIEYQNRDPNMEILHASVNSVRLNLSGSGTLLKGTRPDQVRVRLDLSNSVAGENTYWITSNNITLPPGIVLKEVTPQSVVVDLDVTVRKELPVQIDWVGRLPENVVLAEAVVEPSKVEIIGSKRVLETIQTIYTEKVPLDRLKDVGSIEASLALQPASLKVAPGSTDKVIIKYLTRRRE
jgi:YbbR domain-containing protein